MDASSGEPTDAHSTSRGERTAYPIGAIHFNRETLKLYKGNKDNLMLHGHNPNSTNIREGEIEITQDIQGTNALVDHLTETDAEGEIADGELDTLSGHDIKEEPVYDGEASTSNDNLDTEVVRLLQGQDKGHVLNNSEQPLFTKAQPDVETPSISSDADSHLQQSSRLVQSQSFPMPMSLRSILMKMSLRRALCSLQNNQRRLLSSSSKSQSNNQYCVELVRRCDHENFLACLLHPKDLQRAAFALRAFSIELAQVQDVTSDKRIGLMRMQFWKDSLKKIFTSQSVPQTPIAAELAGACRHYKLSKRWFDRMVEGRTTQLEKDRFVSVQSIEDHAENVISSLNYLMLECAGIKNIHADHAASHLGKAQGLVTVLRATPHHASRRQLYMPIETLAKHKVSQEDFIQGKTSQPVKDVVFEVASAANQHLEKARSFQDSLPKKTNLLFLNAAVCENYLKTIQRVDFNIFDGKLQTKDHLLSFRMYYNKLRGHF